MNKLQEKFCSAHIMLGVRMLQPHMRTVCDRFMFHSSINVCKHSGISCAACKRNLSEMLAAYSYKVYIVSVCTVNVDFGIKHNNTTTLSIFLHFRVTHVWF